MQNIKYLYFLLLLIENISKSIGKLSHLVLCTAPTVKESGLYKEKWPECM